VVMGGSFAGWGQLCCGAQCRKYGLIACPGQGRLPKNIATQK
jgi:hypothetical protein